MSRGREPGPLSKVRCPVPRCDGWYSGRPGVVGCRRCQNRMHKRLYQQAHPQPPKPRPTPPRFPCPTPGCEGTYGGRSKVGCVSCRHKQTHKKRKAERRCHRCVKPLPRDCRRTMCPKCLPEEADRQRICRAERVAAVKCVSCPAPAASWAVQCRRCLARRKVARQKAKAKRANQPNHQRSGR